MISHIRTALVALLLSALLPAAASAEVPYGIDKRPMPEGKEVEKLLPPKVGDFTRLEIEGDLNEDDEVYATYANKERTVLLTVSVLDSIKDAVAGVQASAEVIQETYPKKKFAKPVLDSDPSYFKATNDVHFIAWTRGKYYFSADTSRDPGDLDAFMSAFPY